MSALALIDPSEDSALAIDFADGAYAAGGYPYAGFANVRELVVNGAGGPALTPQGALIPFADNAPRIVPGIGLLLEPESRNKITGMNNAAPTTTAGWGLLANRPVGATLTVVDDMVALYDAQDASGAYIFRALIDAGLMNGKVVRAYNPSTSETFSVPAGGGTGDATVHAFSAYVRCVSGTGNLTMFGGGGSTTDFTGAQWRRVGRTGTPDANRQLNLIVRPQSTVYVILAQLEPGAQMTSPILVSGTAKTRRADKLRINGRRWLSQPHTLLMDVEIARQDNINRQFATLTAPNGKEMAVLRASDQNTLMATQSDIRWRPRLPRVYGPGRVRFVHRVSARGRTLGCGGLLAHDPFRPAPSGLSTLVVGAAADGSSPMNGWVRSIEIMHDVDDTQLEQLCAPPPGSIPLDMARYVSPAGNDNDDGLTPATAWRTLAKAADDTVVPIGTHIMLERGGAWTETLRPLNYCTFRPFGTGGKPIIGNGQTWGIDENGASAWRVQGLLTFGATSRGLNSYGGSGVMVSAMEFSHCGDPLDSNGGGVFMRGNTRGASASWVAVSSSGANLTGLRVTETIRRGVYHLICIQRGTGTASRWELRHSDGALVGTASGNTPFGAIANAFRLTVAVPVGNNPAVGERIDITVQEVMDQPYPTNALAEDFYIALTNLHHIAGLSAGDDVYCEGVAGVIICEGNIHEIPIGGAADCAQFSRCTILYVAQPTHVICRHNYMSMAGATTTSGKGGIVIIAGSALVEGNWVWGLNFCISLNTDDCIVRWNYCEHARYQPYSWGIGIGGNTDVSRNTWYENVVVDCNRAYVISGTGALAVTPTGVVPRLQYRPDVVAYRNVAINCGTGLYFDRPWSGRIFANDNIDCDQGEYVSPAATVVAPGGRFTDQQLIARRAA